MAVIFVDENRFEWIAAVTTRSTRDLAGSPSVEPPPQLIPMRSSLTS